MALTVSYNRLRCMISIDLIICHLLSSMDHRIKSLSFVRRMKCVVSVDFVDSIDRINSINFLADERKSTSSELP